MTDEDLTFDLAEAFRGKESEILGKMKVARQAGHGTTIGELSEENWATALRSFLPQRYGVATKRIIIDSDGRRTQQIDLVVYDPQFAPALVNIDASEVIPIESVYAAFEVKQKLNRHNVREAGRKAESVRRLKRYPGRFGTVKGPGIQDLEEIICGILCTRSGWKEPFGDRFVDALRTPAGDMKLDLGCVVSEGAFVVNSESGKIRISEADVAGGAFHLALFEKLQAFGNASAIDPTRYAKGLWLNGGE